MLRVLTWLWAQPGGRSHYAAEHVNIWAAMVSRHLAMPHELACVTDMAEGIDARVRIITPPGEFEAIRIPTWKEKSGLPQCFRRLSMFRPDAAAIFGPRFVSMDLDCVIAGDLDPLFDHDDDFRMYRGTTSRRPYNGSMVQMTAGARPQVYTTFSARGAIEAGCKFVGSDQAWISHVLGWDEKTWGPEHGVVWHGSRYNVEAPKPWRIMFFPGREKPWQVEPSNADSVWIKAHYATDLREAA
jgi:hypothetical protein